MLTTLKAAPVPTQATLGPTIRSIATTIIGVTTIGMITIGCIGILIAIASGCGYVVWFAALPNLTAARAATVQLAVPAIAAFGGILLLSEPVTFRLLVASAITLGGVALVLSQRSDRTSSK